MDNEQWSLTSSKKRGVLRKEDIFRRLIKEDSLLVRRKEIFPSEKGKDLIMALLASDETNYLLIAVLENWVCVGCEESKVLSQEKLKALDPVRLYERTGTTFWNNLQKKMKNNEIWVGVSDA